MEAEEKSSERIFSLENEIFKLRNKVTTLEDELERKEGELIKARTEISSVRSNITVNRYSDEEYDLLQAQYYQSQRSLAETRSIISDKDLEISQLEGRVEFLTKG